MFRITRSLCACAALGAMAGCYTQFTTLDRYAQEPLAEPDVVIDSLGDTVKVARQVDTVQVRDRQVCYWQRDFFGRPVLRCYKTYYDYDWSYYYDYPWWYDDYTYGHSYGCHCPYHSYYHPGCSYCWQYCNTSHYNYRRTSPSTGSSGGASSPPAATPSSPSRAVGGGASRSGQAVRPSSGGSKPLIAGPRPEPKQTKQTLPKETSAPSGGSATETKSPPADKKSTDAAQSRDTNKSDTAKQPRRRYGRSR